MSTLAILLLVVSAFTHAGWNFWGKRDRPSAAFFLAANTWGAVWFAPSLIVFAGAFFHAPGELWLLLAATGAFQAIYLGALAGAYRAGDMSVAYPLARSSPIIIVAASTVLLGRGEQISGVCAGGIVLVVAGCFLVPMRQFREFRPGSYVNAACLLALLAAAGTAGYTLVDDEALRRLRTAPEWPLANTATAIFYLSLEGFLTSLGLLGFVAATDHGRKELREVVTYRMKGAAIMGAGIYGTYALVLMSMAYVANVSYVAAFRQLSIPLGAVLGIVLLREPPYAPKLLGVGVMFVGLALVALG